MSEVYTPWGCCEELALLAHLAALRDLVNKTGKKRGSAGCGAVGPQTTKTCAEGTIDVRM